MAINESRLRIGAKRQVTIPRDFMKMFSLEEGGELLLQIVEDGAVLIPLVSVPCTELPKNLRKKFLARRGSKAPYIPLDNFLAKKVRHLGTGKAAGATVEAVTAVAPVTATAKARSLA